MTTATFQHCTLKVTRYILTCDPFFPFTPGKPKDPGLPWGQKTEPKHSQNAARSKQTKNSRAAKMILTSTLNREKHFTSAELLQ